MANPTPRVRVPAQAKAGELIEIKTLISHEMESGQRRDSKGEIIPRKIINKFTATFNGKLVFEADWNPAISANPYQSFFYKAKESGEFVFAWKDDDGSTYEAKNKLTVG
ncbi:thiosulfate oxidation carrier complex protein SoxZ [Methylocella sp. CPCC 101449]|jgi:sulfur-oxidizing protein SoxZ|uniref:thiosulfate oxidation carrier complex protein SoxZ n=1 Tax=Methylocella sp. CPCC 101449 TaxID=2987531 RepID=UPI000963C8DA|nr:thiosulfate oxidation carrier complex protein SoxZ [Methylocella sp. CPCC 101449]MBN9079872.1 thiosulfate oxidation carrier complex protein SoxZ [Hyphomicrobiales bacterium]MDT2021181.1 thiosulfate oxidation carrier complex protein SoxZ [Methylocella sp. CPCC 101449]OJY02786.1 MAG: thiosulfate oxidation carrier complex protein SoxZ [Rhizobiales bacterium 62-17]HEV2572370.1 thiosulfate oxidation carrier complex protein SoxZ [Beijerinckiaceae bacterium]